MREKGAKPDQPVGILVDRSLYMIVGIMGILKSGAVYVPIDPDYPKQRIKYMLEDSGASILLSQKHLFKLFDFNADIIDLEEGEIYKGDSDNPEIVNKPRDLAYIIYTSGSTGKPKGVMIEHGSLVNMTLWQKNFVNHLSLVSTSQLLNTLMLV